MDIDAWVWWLIAAAGLGIPLVITAMPELGMLSAGAVAAAVTAALGGDVVLQVIVFAVVSVEQFDKDAFPTDAVYGDLDHPGLRLITCGGAFDPGERSYTDNIVVFADLVPA